MATANAINILLIHAHFFLNSDRQVLKWTSRLYHKYRTHTYASVVVNVTNIMIVFSGMLIIKWSLH